MLYQDSVERNRLAGYWKQLSGVIFGCICLFVFEMCERFGVLYIHNSKLTFIVYNLLFIFLYFQGHATAQSVLQRLGNED